MVVDSLAHVVSTNSINLQHCITGAYIIQTAEIHTLSVLHIPVLKALEDSALAGHRKFPAAAININDRENTYTMLTKVYTNYVEE